MLMLHQGQSITDVHHTTGATRSSIGSRLGWYTGCGVDGLKSLTQWLPAILPIAPNIALPIFAHSAMSTVLWLPT